MKNVDNDVLERHAYEDSEGHTLYICPICDREYPVSYTHLTLPTTSRV